MTLKMRKNRIALILMLSSIGLLLVFEFFWLRKVYNEEKAQFLKEADIAFSEVISDMQDSLIRSVLHAESDSGKVNIRTFNPGGQVRIRSDNVLKRERINFWADSSLSYNHFHRRRAVDTLQKIDIVLSEEAVSDNTIDRKMHQFVLEIDPLDSLRDFKLALLDFQDTLHLEKIQTAFLNSFEGAEGLSLSVERFPVDSRIPVRQGDFATVAVADLPPLHKYALYFPNLRPRIIQRMAPDLLFSLTLLAVTALAFWFIYRALRQQQRLTEIKNDLIRNITHELKTPITTVAVAIEALENFEALDDPRKTGEYLEISKNELNRLSMLVDKVLKTSVFDAKDLEMKIENLDLKALLDRILQSFKIQFDKYSATVDVTVKGDDFNISGDRIHLTSVIYNLLDNAIKYSRPSPQIGIGLKKTNAHIDLSIKDNGIGIPQEFQSRIFDRFFRVPSGDVHNVKGHGLGLSYVASVIEQHGGEIAVRSEPGHGSEFRIQIPCLS
jgi:two-component system phosphate regulon sensor histidine kinase PhoR